MYPINLFLLPPYMNHSHVQQQLAQITVGPRHRVPNVSTSLSRCLKKSQYIKFFVLADSPDVVNISVNQSDYTYVLYLIFQALFNLQLNEIRARPGARRAHAGLIFFFVKDSVKVTSRLTLCPPQIPAETQTTQTGYEVTAWYISPSQPSVGGPLDCKATNKSLPMGSSVGVSVWVCMYVRLNLPSVCVWRLVWVCSTQK